MTKNDFNPVYEKSSTAYQKIKKKREKKKKKKENQKKKTPPSGRDTTPSSKVLKGTSSSFIVSFDDFLPFVSRKYHGTDGPTDNLL